MSLAKRELAGHGSTLHHPTWCKNAVMYQINTRQFSPDGNFKGIVAQLPRLKALGIDILYLMPINPIGMQNRKGSLGSPYAISDYLRVNPELGTLDDFKALVAAIHQKGMYVIIDWVANHSAWDNVLVDSHPDWYSRNQQGHFHPTPWWDWDDIIDFDYAQPELRDYMANAMRYWVEECDIDGFRCDVAGFVPLDFWVRVRLELQAIKPVLMLAEWESRDLHQEAFDLSYAWSWNEAMHAICTGKAGLSKLFKYYSWHEKSYPRDAIKLTFVSNHDKNAWDGTEFEQFGEGVKAALVLSFAGDGMPLIYNGQEVANPRRLAFFERDPINWQAHPIGEFYQQLIQLKKSHTALANGAWGAKMQHVFNSQPDHILSFVRQDQNSKLLVIINLSDTDVQVSFQGELVGGNYLNYFTKRAQRLDTHTKLSVSAWDFCVLLG